MKIWQALEAKMKKAFKPSNEQATYARKKARKAGGNPKPPHPHN